MTPPFKSNEPPSVVIGFLAFPEALSHLGSAPQQAAAFPQTNP
jgi:hypothetical protein